MISAVEIFKNSLYIREFILAPVYIFLWILFLFFFHRHGQFRNIGGILALIGCFLFVGRSLIKLGYFVEELSSFSLFNWNSLVHIIVADVIGLGLGGVLAFIGVMFWIPFMIKIETERVKKQKEFLEKEGLRLESLTKKLEKVEEKALKQRKELETKRREISEIEKKIEKLRNKE